MNDLLPSVFLVAAGGYFYWTATRPDHGNPKTAKVTGIALAVLGALALIYSLILRAI